MNSRPTQAVASGEASLLRPLLTTTLQTRPPSRNATLRVTGAKRGKSYPSRCFTQPGVRAVPETSVAGVWVVLVGTTALVVEGSSVAQAALAAAVVAENREAVGTDTMDLVTPGAGLEVAEASGVLAIHYNHGPPGFGSMKGRKLWPPWWWRPTCCQTATPRWARHFRRQQPPWPGRRGFNDCRETTLSRRGGPDKAQVTRGW